MILIPASNYTNVYELIFCTYFDGVLQIEQNSSNGIMFKVAGDDGSDGITPSPLTQEFQRRVSTKSNPLPPGCPRGGLQELKPTPDQVNPVARHFQEE
eukprot:m.103096 g.103096  ORF g.103096 m.103096 type:complete len:98 (+) comp12607_c0_seq2:758-1051(+)